MATVSSARSRPGLSSTEQLPNVEKGVVAPADTVQKCLAGISSNEAPIVQALTILKRLHHTPNPAAHKAAIQVVLDHVLHVLEASSDVWTPSLSRKQTLQSKLLDSDMREWLSNETTTSLRPKRESRRRTKTVSKDAHEAKADMLPQIRRLSIAGSLLTEETSKKYTKKIHVLAFRLGAPLTVSKSWGVSSGIIRDWIIISQMNDIYVCSEAVFSQTYEPVPGRLNTFRKTGSIFAVKKTHPFEVVTTSGIATGKAGDYLAQSLGGEQWTVPAAVFESTYELDATNSTKMMYSPSTYFITELSSSEAVATQNMIHGFADWNFDSVAFHELTKGHCLTWLAKHSFESFDLFSKYDIHESELENFVLAIETSHSAHPYHNVLRAGDVFYSMAYFIKHLGLRNVIQPAEILGCLLAALFCGCGHPGLDANFLIATDHELTSTYNCQSVLQHHQCATAFTILKQFDIFSRMSEHTRRKVRRFVIDMVFALDMTTHFDLLSKWNDKVKKTVDVKNADDRLLLMKIAFKCANVAFFAKNKELFSTWSERLQKELFNQGDMERSHGLPISPFMDRTAPMTNAMLSAHMHFIARPMFQSFSAFVGLEKDACREMLENLYRNATSVATPPASTVS